MRLILVTRAYRALERKLQEIVAERDSAIRDRDDANRRHQEMVVERDTALRDRDEALRFGHQTAAERDFALLDRDDAIRRHQELVVLRDTAIRDRDDAIRMRDEAAVDRDSALSERDDAVRLRQQMVENRDSAIRDRDDAIRLHQEAIAELEKAMRNCENATRLHEVAAVERENAVRDRDNALRLQQDMVVERDVALRERNDAISQRDEVLKRESQRTTRHFVFCHIPRTGGSSVWHALAECAAKSGVPILDLYWLSLSQYGSTGFAYNVLTDHSSILSRQSTLIHLHTFDNIRHLLPEKEIVYATIVRDPIERFCSDIAHLHNALLKFSESDREIFFAKVPWKRDLKTLMIDDTASLDALLDMAAKESFFRFFYFHFFFAVLCAKPIPMNEFEPPNMQAIDHLAGRIKERFAYIGRYPEIAESFHNIAERFGLPHDRSQKFTQHINRSDVNQRVQSSRERFADVFQQSYQLLEAIGQTF